MYSKLVFDSEGEEIEFTAHDLILAAMSVMQEMKASSVIHELEVPNYKTVDEVIDTSFWAFSQETTTALDKHYDIEEFGTRAFLDFTFDICVNQPHNMLWIVAKPQHADLLNDIKTKAKKAIIEFKLDEHIVIPANTLRPTSIKHWVWTAQYLKQYHLQQEHIKGWWFNIGGRIIRLRNDVLDGALAQGNKQFYAGDHGSVPYILNQVQSKIEICINNFTWGDGGTYYHAFLFWLYFTLNKFLDYKQEFIERAANVDVKDKKTYQIIFDDLGKMKQKPVLVKSTLNLTNSELLTRKQIYLHTFSRYLHKTGAMQLESSIDDWLQHQFMCELTDQILSAYNSGRFHGNKVIQQECDVILEKLFYQAFRPDVTPLTLIPEKDRRARAEIFDELFKKKSSLHQAALKEEFIAHMNEGIVASPTNSQRLLLSLGSAYVNVRGQIDDNNWSNIKTWFIGERSYLIEPDIKINNYLIIEKQKYEAVFDRLIEQFRYITEAILRQRVQLWKEKYLSPFYTQVAQIMHVEDAQKYIMAHTLCELAKAINHGKYEPIIREVTAYGDAVNGDSYHKFEETIAEYFSKADSMPLQN